MSLTRLAEVVVDRERVTHIELSNIPSTFAHLRMVIMGRQTGEHFEHLGMRFNGDDGEHYDTRHLVAYGAADEIVQTDPWMGQTAIMLGALAAGVASPRFASSVTADIPLYAQDRWEKTVIANACRRRRGGDLMFMNVAGAWRDTSPIQTISLFTGADLAMGSCVSLYGLS